MCYGLKVCEYVSLTCQYVGLWKWDFWETIRSRGWTFMNALSVLLRRDMRERSNFTSHESGGLPLLGTSLVAQRVKCLPAVQETWVQSLGWEDSLEKEMATHSSTLAWKIPWTEEPGRLQSMGSQRVRHD